ncbi:XRE family transcriptional regulator (plasmid) [Deinococcus taeanensis]|uniref:helix-turn-helix domain-containing protein n=1 Tax=Deinococcus taeanensis TaxID=2737050 RepID=UPI001CDBE4BC|nr:XRE family transcriptional regulator [Deinococcus taeanensis]UBV44571.1 XRE family transcriptional regulator [Deinococcus taeanensis]
MADALDHALRRLADNLRHYRIQRAWTQDDLAQASGISRRMIAALEAAQSNVSLSTLDHLAQALNLTFVELVSPRLSSGTGEVQRGATLWTVPHSASQAVLVNTAPARHGTELWHWHLSPGEHYVASPDPQGMMEILYVLHGELTIEFQNRTTRLHAGDSVTYPSDQPYTYRNTGPTLTEFIRNVTH